MPIEPGYIVDDKYLVEGVCSESGGMGSLMFVQQFFEENSMRIVLKYCREDGEEFRTRFKREVRLLQEFQGNSKVVEIVDANLDHEPPYFVMKYYSDGDLMSLHEEISGDYGLQEEIFMQMIECVGELHRANKFHRDIKPQNFLRDGKRIVLSDFGLSTELESKTAFTRSSVFWGTHGYLPPEFHHGGFKHASAAGDIFMLGKSFYVLLTGRDPLYLVGDGVPAPLFVIIERCCALNKDARYQDLASLRQSLTAAYDVLLGRVHGPARAGAMLGTVMDRLEKDGQFKTEEVQEFIEQLALLDEEAQEKICFELKADFFLVIKEEPIQSSLQTFLKVYRNMVENASYGWSYAEVIADNMRIIFDGSAVSPANKTLALELAIIGAYRQNRFAAMDTCQAMIASVVDEDLAMRIRELILQYRDTPWVVGTEISKCKHSIIKTVLEQLQTVSGSA